MAVKQAPAKEQELVMEWARSEALQAALSALWRKRKAERERRPPTAASETSLFLVGLDQ